MLTAERGLVPWVIKKIAGSEWPLRIGIAAVTLLLSLLLLKLSLDAVARHPEFVEPIAVAE